jgi:hypothetical protein
MKQIPLTQGRVALVDDQDFEYLTGIANWCFSSSEYAVAYLRRDDGRRTTVSMHRLVMARILGKPVPADLQVDHKNRNRLDARRENLRLATRSQNQSNKGLQINNYSGFKGVSVDGRKFRVRIRFNRRFELHLGHYDDLEFAARVYDACSRLLNKDFAGLNFPDEPTTPEILALVMTFIERNPAALAFITGREQGRASA